MRRVGGRKGRLLFAICLGPFLVLWLSLAGLLNAQWTRLDQRRFPWAYAESGHPTLTGVWVGTLATSLGTKRGLLLHLRLVPLKLAFTGRRTGLRFLHRQASENLTGELHVCGGPKGEQHFTLHGNVVTDDASRFRLELSVADSAPADGLAPSALRGIWNGRDSLGVDADLYVSYRGERVVNLRDSETNTPQPGVLHRADSTDFRTVCERLWTRS